MPWLDFDRGLGFDGSNVRAAAAMPPLELTPEDISNLNDSDLRELVGRLCEAELTRQSISTARLTWGGAQQATDGGLDVELRHAAGVQPQGFLPRPDVGLQVKEHTVGETACFNEMHLSGSLRPVIAELADLRGAYILVSGRDSCTSSMLRNRVRGMRKAVEKLPNKDDLHLDFYGADRLAMWLRQHPGVALWARLRLGKPVAGWRPFGRWAHTPTGTEDAFLADEFRSVFDKDSGGSEPFTLLDGIALTRARLRAPGSAVRLTGLSGVGKTRFAQALFESDVGSDPLPASDVIYADLGEELSPTATAMLIYLVANDLACHIVLDNCPPDVHRSLQKQMRAENAQVRLLTIEYDISDDSPEQTTVIHLEPSSVESVSRLVQRRYPELELVNADRIAEFAGGNARIALAMASRVGPDESLSTFKDDDLFDRLFSQRKGKSTDLLKGAEILSLAYSFNTSKEELNDELGVLGEISGISRKQLHRDQSELLSRQLAQKRGHWRAVLPHALSNRLAQRALANIDATDINAELLKPENARLLASCAHRLGYLHDCEQARVLALSWTQPGAPLANIAALNRAALTVLNYVAPVFPETVLTSIEKAAHVPGFTSRQNEHWLTFANLLQHLAYKQSTFARAFNVMLAFARNEKASDKNSESIIHDMQQLFSIRMSGTQASPEQRQALLAILLASAAPRDRQIVSQLLISAFDAHFSPGYGEFYFGAHKHGFGWQPEDEAQALAWYVGFLDLLKPLLNGAPSDRRWAGKVLADSFGPMWATGLCYDALEALITPDAGDGQWTDLWIAIKQTLAYADDPPDIQARLLNLEALTAPTDTQSQLEAYVLIEPWEHSKLDPDALDNTPELWEKARQLGELAAANTAHLDQLGARLWTAEVSPIWHFGRGLANGSAHAEDTLNSLIAALRTHTSEPRYAGVINGFIYGVNERDPKQARALLERSLDAPELTTKRVHLLTSIPVDTWGAEKLISMAAGEQLPASAFRALMFGLKHEPISDEDFACLLTHVNNLPSGCLSTLELLKMRFHNMTARGYTPEPVLITVARDTIRALVCSVKLKDHRQELQGLERVIDVALHVSAPDAEVQAIIDAFCEGIESYRIYATDVRPMTSALIKRFPEMMLDALFASDRNERHLTTMLFRDTSRVMGVSFNEADNARVLAWCAGDQTRLEQVARAMRPFVRRPKDADAASLDARPNDIVLSASILAVMHAAPDKAAITKIVFERIPPHYWHQELSLALRSRAQAFEELAHYPDSQVQAFVRHHLPLIEARIVEEQTMEAAEHTEREQRFE